MKKSFMILFALYVGMFFTSCKKEEKPSKKEGLVEFGYAIKQLKATKQLKSADMMNASDAAYVLVSIENVSGGDIYNREKIELYNFNGEYISKPISLVPGNYALSEFMVLDENDSILYVTPKEGSEKAYLVENPLNIEFTISKDEVTKVVPEVISPVDSSPDDFGYSTFSFELVETFDFLAGVFVYNEEIQDFELTEAHIEVNSNGNVIYSDFLDAVTNQITLRDGFDSCQLIVSKLGYETYSKTFSIAELKSYYSSEENGPMEIVLLKEEGIENVITLVSDQTILKSLRIGITSQYLSIDVDWGDGIIEHYDFSQENNFWLLQHDYQNTGIYKTSIVVNYGEIIVFDASASEITSISISEGVNINVLVSVDNYLESFRINDYLQVINFENNSLTSIEEIGINSTIHQLLLSNNNFDSDQVNQLLNDIKNSVIANPRPGELDISNNAPPTGQGLIDLEILRDNYSWQITL